MQQFFVQEDQIGNGFITITGADVRRIKKDLKLNAGEKICVSTIEGQDYCCEIAMISDNFVQAQILDEEVPKAEVPTDIYLFQALPKDDRMEIVVQKAAELGVYEVIPVAMKNCVGKLDERKIEKKRTKWQALADSAAEETQRSFFPHVHRLMSFDETLAYAKEYCEIRLVPYEEARNMKKTVKTLEKVQPGRSLGILIGPEGGFAEDEIDAARACMDVISLGQQVLHTDTAAVCALYLVKLELEKKSRS